MSSTDETTVPDTDPIDARLIDDVHWFADKAKSALGNNLRTLAIYGPAVSSIYEPRDHRIHVLLVLVDRDVDGLLQLAKSSSAATKRRFAPPLVTTATAMMESRDVFPLEWIDIVQYHHVVHGEFDLSLDQFKPADVRVQCERDLRSLDIQLQRGVLASGGRADRIDALERDAADTLIRVFRGIAFLTGTNIEQLPLEACDAAAAASGVLLPGCRDSIQADRLHDLATFRLMLSEIAELIGWINRWQPV